MTLGKPSKTPPRTRVDATARELWYLDCFRKWAAHYKRSPSIRELAGYCGRTHTPVSIALESLWRKGHLEKNVEGQYVEIAA